MNYHDKEENIFKKWIALSVNNNHGGEDVFARDGLTYRGEIKYSADGCWHRFPGLECCMWDKAKYKIMLITKDLNDKKPWDIRQETGRANRSGENNIKINVRFYQNYMLWVYGLLNILKSGCTPDFNEINDDKIYWEFYDSIPIVRLNCKKQIGGNRISYKDLNLYIDSYEDLLLKQIALYNANIIICGGGSNSIKNFICSKYLKNFERVNDWIYYSVEDKRVVVDSYHPSYFRLSKEKIYTSMMKAFDDFITKFPDFRK